MTESARDRARIRKIIAENPRPIWRARPDACDACRGLDGQRVVNAKPPHPYCTNRTANGPGCRCLLETTLQESA